MIGIIARAYLGMAIAHAIRMTIMCIKEHRELRDYFRDMVQNEIYKKCGLYYDWYDPDVNRVVDACIVVVTCLFIATNGLAWPVQLFKDLTAKIKGS